MENIHKGQRYGTHHLDRTAREHGFGDPHHGGDSVERQIAARTMGGFVHDWPHDGKRDATAPDSSRWLLRADTSSLSVSGIVAEAIRLESLAHSGDRLDDETGANGNEPTATAERPEYTFKKPEGLLAQYTTATVVFKHILPTIVQHTSPRRAEPRSRARAANVGMQSYSQTNRVTAKASGTTEGLGLAGQRGGDRCRS